MREGGRLGEERNSLSHEVSGRQRSSDFILSAVSQRRLLSKGAVWLDLYCREDFSGSCVEGRFKNHKATGRSGRRF